MLTIQDNRLAGVSLLPDDFVDYYMPRANGEFVKIYLYLLRATHRAGADPTLSAMADTFSCPEKDVLRALRYWEKAGLLSLHFRGKEKELSVIELHPISASLAKTQQDPAKPTEEECYMPAAAADAPAAAPKAAQAAPEGSGTQGAAPPKGLARSAKSTAAASAPAAIAGRSQISTSRLKDLKSDEEARQILFVTEQYMGHPLSPTDMRRILYFYDELHFSPELIDYLVDYCVTRGGRSLNYIEKVGLAWNQEGITTVKAAKEHSAAYRDKYFAIFRAFGIRGRNPIPDEIRTMEKWLGSYGFSLDLIREAAARTIRQTGQPSFPYADRILSDWRAAGVREAADIARLDAPRQGGAREARGARTGQGGSHRAAQSPAQGGSTKFNENFHQRDYDFAALEQQLLQSPQA